MKKFLVITFTLLSMSICLSSYSSNIQKTKTKEISNTTISGNISTPSTTKNTASDNAISLYYGGGDILCGTTENNMKSLIKCLTSNDEVGWNQMFTSGQAFTVPSKTKAIVLETKLTVTKVRICEGTYKDQIAWVIMEAAK